MSEYLRRFLRDYHGIADNPHIFNVTTQCVVVKPPGWGALKVRKQSTIHFTQTNNGATASITLPMCEVGLFLYGLELYKMGNK